MNPLAPPNVVVPVIAPFEILGDVKIIRNGEEIIGDYGTLDTKNNSYKIKSDKQKKVKAIIINNE